MTELEKKKRPEFRNINVLEGLPHRLPIGGYVSILHRVSGMLMFVLLPFIIWMLDTSLSSEFSFATFKAVFNEGCGFIPGWFIKLVTLAIIWAYLHHLMAGVRHLAMDMCHNLVSKSFAKSSSIVVLILSIGATVVLGAKLFGLY
jgi:succinate dehydrogenase / fumarate reductase, cytochrome b subunit